MNTDTPETNQWETYCDECYYHMWRLRRKNERGFNDGFHINKGDEAKGLCDLLNNLERERDEAMEALDRIARPVWWMEEDQKRKTGSINGINGRMALALSQDAEYLKGIAKSALKGEAK